jgi:hypothetical protein
MADEEAPPARTLQDYLNPERVTQQSPIVFPRPTTVANTFVFKPDYHRCIPFFHGMEREDPYQHIRTFEETLQSFVTVEAHLNQARLRLFPFTLKDKAKTWFHSLKPQSLNSWQAVQDAFHTKFFPASRTKLLMDHWSVWLPHFHVHRKRIIRPSLYHFEKWVLLLLHTFDCELCSDTN